MHKRSVTFQQVATFQLALLYANTGDTHPIGRESSERQVFPLKCTVKVHVLVFTYPVEDRLRQPFRTVRVHIMFCSFYL